MISRETTFVSVESLLPLLFIKIDQVRHIRHIVFLVLLVSSLLGGCATQKARKIPKKGPIPCPIKDC